MHTTYSPLPLSPCINQSNARAADGERANTPCLCRVHLWLEKQILESFSMHFR